MPDLDRNEWEKLPRKHQLFGGIIVLYRRGDLFRAYHTVRKQTIAEESSYNAVVEEVRRWKNQRPTLASRTR